MVQTEATVAVYQPMVAEETAGGVANYDIGAAARRRTLGAVERRVIAPEIRAGTGDCQASPCHLAPLPVMQDEFGLAGGVPGCRGGIDEVAERVVRRRAEAQEKPRRQAGRAAGIDLRLGFIGQHGIEDMGAEAGLGGMAAGAVL